MTTGEAGWAALARLSVNVSAIRKSTSSLVVPWKEDSLIPVISPSSQTSVATVVAIRFATSVYRSTSTSGALSSTFVVAHIQQLDAGALPCQALECKLNFREALELDAKPQSIIESRFLLRGPSRHRLGPKLPKLPHQDCTMPLAVARRDVGPSAAFLRRAIWLYFGDALQNKVPISLLGPVCHALCSGSQAGRDVAAFFEHRGDLCFFHAPRPGVDQHVLQGFVRGARDVGVTQPCGGGSQPTP